MPSPAPVEVWISAASPLLSFPSLKTGDTSSLRNFNKDGSCQYKGKETFAVEVQAIFFTNINFLYTSSNSWNIQAGIDKSIEPQSATNNKVSLSTPFGSHSAQLQMDCADCKEQNEGDLVFQGVRIQTQVVESGGGNNNTLDDASTQIIYSGFQSTSASSSDVSAIHSGSFHENTVSYTSAGGASASFLFKASAFYVFGMTGPGFGSFQVSIDSQVAGTFNASTNTETYNTLLFFTTYLDSTKSHQVTITNQNDGLLFALDYISYVVPEGKGSQTVSGTQSGATAVFPSQGANNSQPRGGDSGGAVIGVILGTLGGLFLLWICWRYRQWKKGGGEGSFLAALCGGFRKKKEEKKEENKFHLWPMVWSRPKYAT